MGDNRQVADDLTGRGDDSVNNLDCDADLSRAVLHGYRTAEQIFETFGRGR